MIDLTSLLLKQESEILEFKEAKQSFDVDKLGKYFSALSNEANLSQKECAYLLFGINDKKNIVGTSINDNTINNYKLEISKNTSPTMSFNEVERINTDNGDVLCFVIPAAPKGMPIAWKDLYYGRAGESLGGLNINEIEKIRNQTRNSDWSMQIIPNASINDLSQDAINLARQQFSVKNPHLDDQITSWDDITFLNKAKITIDGQITNAAIVLLGKPESEHFISPAVAHITWILKDRDGIEKDYEHFSCPFILSTKAVYAKIRNLKYRYMLGDSIFPEEVQQYDPYIIRESLNNCIAHQDYTKCGRIIVVEYEDGKLVFKNPGNFIPGTVEKVLNSNAPENYFRNTFLANAMVNLKMIDIIGSGIRKMFLLQKNKFFPLPEYNFSNNEVEVTITGKVLDLNYAKKLAVNKDLSLSDILLLDKVQKNKKLTDEEYKNLKSKKLIEGRKNNYFISSSIAKITHEEPIYTNLKGFEDDFYEALILRHIDTFGFATKNQLVKLLFNKLPESLSEEQKNNKLKNLLQKLKNKNIITIKDRKWVKV